MRIAICDDEKRICAILAEKVGKICPVTLFAGVNMPKYAYTMPANGNTKGV